MKEDCLRIAMLSIHSDPIGELGTKDTGGMSVYIRELARELGRREHRIDIFTRSQENKGQFVTQLYEKEIVDSCHRILAPTERERDSLIRLYGAPAEKIGVVPCGVNLDIFYPQSKTAAPKKLGLDPAETILLYVGRFEPLKGLNRLLEAMTHQKHHRPIRLLIVGGDGNKDPEYQALEDRTRKLKIGEKVLFAGRIDQHNLPPYYSAADVMVMPSHYESFGMVGLEALACGRPVVSTPVGAVDSLIRKALAGCVVPDPSPGSLADGIQSIISDRTIPTADVIRKSILEYSWPNVTSAIIAEYKNAIRQQFFEDDQRVPTQVSYG